MPNFRALISLFVLNSQTKATGIRCSTTNLQILLNTPKIPYLNQAIQKRACQIFLPSTPPNPHPPPKKNRIERSFKPKKSSDHPRHLTSGVPLPGYRVIQFINRLDGNETNMITVSCWKSHHYLWKAAIINRHTIISNLKKKIHKVIIIDWNGKARQEALAVFTLYADHPPLKGYK